MHISLFRLVAVMPNAQGGADIVEQFWHNLTIIRLKIFNRIIVVAMKIKQNMNKIKVFIDF